MSEKKVCKMNDEAMQNVVGGTDADDAPQYKIGDIVHIVNNCTPIGSSGSGSVKIITVQGQITSEPYKDFFRDWCYDVLILNQNAFYDGYSNFIGQTMKKVTDRMIAAGANHVAKNGITF